MIEIKILGIGGQGAVLAAKLLADAAARSGFNVQSFSEYGSQRRGGKVESYVRISSEPVSVHCKMYELDYVIMMNEIFIKEAGIAYNIKKKGGILINTPSPPEDFSSLGNFRILTVNASHIATKNRVLLPSGMPIINTTVLGALVGMIPEIEIDSLIEAIKEGKIPAADKNINAAKEAYDFILYKKASFVTAEEESPEIVTIRYPVYRDRQPPCEASCPAGHIINKTISLIQENFFEEALENIKAENPFPGMTGRICFHPCETNCNANEYSAAIAISALERAAFDNADISKVKKPVKKENTGKKVAIVGSGPAGLTCAYFLAIMGHTVTVLEALSIPGGVPRIAIPEYRLAKDVVDKEIAQVIELGVEIKTNTRVGQEISFEDILGKYDACFIATGAHRSIKLNIQGEKSEGVISGLEFLKNIALGNKVDLGKRVAVIGGGNTAIDAARSARRLGAKEVTIIYRRSIKEIPALWEEVEAAEREGIKIRYLNAPIKIKSSGGRVDKLECLKTRLGDQDSDGRFLPVNVEGTNFMLDVDNVITAIGESLEVSFLPNTIEMTGSLIKVDELGRTSIPGIYAGGDITNASWNVSEAIGSGKRAAIGIDIYLKDGGGKEIDRAVQSGKRSLISMERYLKGEMIGKEADMVSFSNLNVNYFSKAPRVQISETSIPARVQNFNEVRLGFSKSEAMEEAKRCFHCGYCNLCGNCFIFCPDTAVTFDEKISTLAINHSLCKGCGMCIRECPRDAIAWEGEG